MSIERTYARDHFRRSVFSLWSNFSSHFPSALDQLSVVRLLQQLSQVNTQHTLAYTLGKTNCLSQLYDVLRIVDFERLVARPQRKLQLELCSDVDETHRFPTKRIVFA